jgi:hypothetical protein
MRKIAIVVIHLLLSTLTQAQLIENRLNIYLSYSVGSFSGSETINEDNYIAPSLYPNYNKLSGFSVKGLINSGKYLSYGINYDYLSAHEWTSSNYSDFGGSEIQLHSITPLARFHNKFMGSGLSNRLLVFIECGPTIGFSDLVLARSLFEIHTNEYNSTPPMSDRNVFTGFKGNIGIDYSFAQCMGFFVSYSYRMDWVSSKLYDDDTIKCSLINAGLIMKLKKNKYLYY